MTRATNMAPALMFAPAAELGRELVTLGNIRIGEVSASLHGAHRATYRLWLPDLRSSPRPAPSVEMARHQVRQAVEDWLVRAGIFYPGQAIELHAADLAGAGDDAEAG